MKIRVELFALVIALGIGMSTSAVQASSVRVKRQADIDRMMREFLHIINPIKEYKDKNIQRMFEHLEAIDDLIKGGMRVEDAILPVAAQIYSKITQDIVADEQFVYPQGLNLSTLIDQSGLREFVGSHIDLDRVAGAVKPFLTSAMTYDDTYDYLLELYNVLEPVATSLSPDILLVAFNAAIDKVEALGDIDAEADRFLTVFLKRARAIHDGINGTKERDFMVLLEQIIAVEIHDMIMHEFLAMVGAKPVNISESIKSLGVPQFIGQVDHLDRLVNIVQPFLSKNLTLNESLAIITTLYDYAKNVVKSELEYRTIKELFEKVLNKTEGMIPDPIRNATEFNAFLHLVKDLLRNMNKSEASEFSAYVMGNLVYNYVMEHLYPMANISHVNIMDVLKQHEVDQRVKGVISLPEMARTLQPVIHGDLTLNQSMEVFTQMMKLIQGDVGNVSPNTVELMAHNLLDLDKNGTYIPDPENEPLFKEFVTRVHHTYVNMPEGQLKDYFQTVITNRIFTRVTHLDISRAASPDAMNNLFNKMNVSKMLGVDVDRLTALFRPMFNRKLDLEKIPFVLINAVELFSEKFTDESITEHTNRIKEIMKRAIVKIKPFLPDPINNYGAYKQLMVFVEQAKKSLSTEEASILTSIFGELRANATDLVDQAKIRENLGNGFNFDEFTRLLEPVLDGTQPLEQIPMTFVLLYRMMKVSGEQLDEEKLDEMFGALKERMKLAIPNPFTESKEYRRFISHVQIAKAGLDREGREFLSEFLEAEMDETMEDMGVNDIEDGRFYANSEMLQAIGVMEQYKHFLKKLDDMTTDDILTLIELMMDVGESAFGNLISMAGGIYQMSPDEIAQIPPELFGILNEDTLKLMAERLSEEQKDAFCGVVLEADGKTAGELMRVVDCGGSFMRLRQRQMMRIDEELERQYVDNLKRAKPMEQFSGSEWDTMLGNFAEGMDPEDFAKIPLADLKRNTRITGELPITGVSAEMEEVRSMGAMAQQDLGEEETIEMFDRLEEGYMGDLANMDGETLGGLGRFLDRIPVGDLERISPQEKMKALSGLKGQRLSDQVAAVFAEDLLSEMPPPRDWGKNELENVLDFIKYDEDVMEDIPIDTLVDGIDAIGQHGLSETEATTFVDRFLQDDKYKKPSSWGASLLEKAAPLMSAMPPDFLDGLDADNLLAAMGASDSFAKIDFPKTAGRKLLDKVMKDIGDDGLNLQMIKKMGKMIKSLQSDEISKMPAQNMRESLPHFKIIYLDMDSSTRRVVINKLKQLPGGLAEVLNEMGPFFADMTMDELDELPYDSIQPKKLSSNDTFDAKPTPAQARRLYDNIKRPFGSPDQAVGNWTMNFWKFLGRGICGMPCADILKIPLNKKITSVLKLFAERGECLDDGQIRCLATRMKTLVWDTTNDMPIQDKITKSSLSSFGRFIAYLNVTDIEKLNNSLCGHVISSIGKHPLDNLPRSDLIELKKYALKCAGKLKSGTIKDEELRMAGDIVCGIEEADLDRFDAKLFKNHFSDFSERCNFPTDVEQKLLARGMEIMQLKPANLTVKDLVKIRASLPLMSESNLKAIPKDTLVKGTAQLMKGFKKKEEKMEKRRGMGMPVTTDTEAENKVNKVIIEAMVEKRNKRKTSDGRAKRAASQSSSLTCSDLKKLGSGVTALTLTQLDITKAHFSSCSDFLGAITGWSSSQKQQLAHTAKLAWGKPDTWSTFTLVTAGTIVQGLSDSDLSSLNIDSIDAISALGKYTGWTSTQLSTVFSSWLSGSQSNLAVNVDITELQSVGEFACGATTSQIEALPPSSYKGAATKIGTMASCMEAQLAAYAALAKKDIVFGPVTSWDGATVSVIGNVIGGITADDIKGLTQTQIEALSLAAIAKIPNTSFRAFTTTQFGYFSSSQANAVTPTQMLSLSEEQKAALSAAGAITTDVQVPGGTNPPPGSSAPTAHQCNASTSISLLVLLSTWILR